MSNVTAEQRAAWRRDAEAHADETRHPSGYYPSARILALLDALPPVAEPSPFVHAADVPAEWQEPDPRPVCSVYEYAGHDGECKP